MAATGTRRRCVVRFWPASLQARRLRNPESILQDHNSPAVSFRAQKVPSANPYCFSAAMG
jgi:hypothetical protein